MLWLHFLFPSFGHNPRTQTFLWRKPLPPAILPRIIKNASDLSGSRNCKTHPTNNQFFVAFTRCIAKLGKYMDSVSTVYKSYCASAAEPCTLVVRPGRQATIGTIVVRIMMKPQSIPHRSVPTIPCEKLYIIMVDVGRACD